MPLNEHQSMRLPYSECGVCEKPLGLGDVLTAVVIAVEPHSVVTRFVHDFCAVAPTPEPMPAPPAPRRK